MKRIAGVVILLTSIFLATGTEGAVSRTISWRNPTTYEDNSKISAASRAIIETRLYYSLDRVSWTRFATVSAGKESWTGLLPVDEGIPGYYAVTTTIPSEGRESKLSLSESFTEPITEESSFPVHIFRASVLPTEDTFVGRENDRNHSDEPSIGTYTWPANVIANRGFILWDLSAIPPEASVISATLWLFYVSEEWDGGDGEYTVSVSKVVGVQPDLKHSTWNTYDGVSPWTGGGDGGTDDLAPAESSATIGKRHRWVKWDVTEMVGERLASLEPDLVMAVDADSIATADSNRFFASLEYPEPALRPRLEVEYKRSSFPVPPESVRNAEDTGGIGTGISFASRPPASGFLVSMEPEEDTFIDSGDGSNNNYATDNTIRTYTWPAGFVANRGFLKWDLSVLPDDAFITGATLWLYSEGGEAAQGDPLYWVGIYQVSRVTPDLRRMTWNTFEGTQEWTGGSDGGAENMSLLASLSGIGKEAGWISWNVTEIVREGNGVPGDAIVMAVDGDPEAGVDSSRYFASRDHSDASLHPRLVVTYTMERPPSAEGASISSKK